MVPVFDNFSAQTKNTHFRIPRFHLIKAKEVKNLLREWTWLSCPNVS